MSRQALWPSAQAIQLLPMPVGPVMSKFCLRPIQSPSTSLAKNARSMPRGARRSTSSTTAVCRSEANFRRAMSRLFSRSVASRSIMQAEPLLEGERGDIGLALLIIEGLGHAGEPEREQAFVGVVGEHKVSFLQVSGSSRGHGCCRAGWDRRRGAVSGRKALSRPVLRIEAIDR